MRSGRKTEDQIGEVRTIRFGRFQSRVMPDLSAGQVICRVCDQPAIDLPADNKPGQRYRHDGRSLICRYIPKGKK